MIEIMGITLPNESCEFCGHWVKQTKKNSFDLEGGLCKRHAPQPKVSSEYDAKKVFIPVWPRTFPTYECGEWVDKDVHYKEQLRRANLPDKNEADAGGVENVVVEDGTKTENGQPGKKTRFYFGSFDGLFPPPLSHHLQVIPHLT